MMHSEHEHELDRVAETVFAAAPVDDQTAVERVMTRDTTGSTTLRTHRLAWPTAVAAAAVVILAAAVFYAVELQPKTSMAFAEEDALAALSPANGYIIHAKTRTWAQNAGESKPIIDGTLYDEIWLDLTAQRERFEMHDAETNHALMTAITADGRSRYFGENPDEPETGEVISEGYADRVGAGSLWPYYYLKTMVPEGKVVGEVEREGQTYWDVRWNDVEDDAGNKLDARALLRQPDYSPGLIERNYPGGVHEVWEVLDWEVIPLAELPDGHFDPLSIGAPDTPLQVAWRIGDLPDHISYPVYWAGKKLGKTSAGSEFIVRTNYASAATSLMGDNTIAWYSGDSEAEYLTIASAPAERAAGLTEKLAMLGSDTPTMVKTPLGPASILKAESGSWVAAIAAPGAGVVVEAKNRSVLESALAKLQQAE